tara:strand:+ start:698 stop:1789 length:1092 start_codon:yes stop_codon:yes gene_type:complete
MKADYCTPDKANNFYTCFSNDALVKIADEFNKEHKNKIEIPKKFNNKNRKKLWEQIQHGMKAYTNCNEDYCLLDSKLVRNINDKDIHGNTFRPEMPESWNDNMNAWLSTIDIAVVMKQYEKKYKDFLFIGPVPIDFDLRIGFGMCISNELCNIDIEDLIKKGKTKIGIVFNLDPHNRGGSHWVSMYTDLMKGGIYFFDSYAHKPKQEIYQLMKRLKEQGNQLIMDGKINIDDFNDDHIEIHDAVVLDEFTIKLDSTKNIYTGNLVYLDSHKSRELNLVQGVSKNKIQVKYPIINDSSKRLVHKSFRLYYNTNRFQYKNSECGVYSMHFIEEFLNGKSFEEITNNIFNDDEINKKRNFYYRPNL